MPSVKRKTYTSTLPPNATIRGTVVKWTSRNGAKRSGTLVVKDGAKFVRYQSDTWYAQYRDAEGIVRTVATGCRDRDSAEAKLKSITKQVDKINAGIYTQLEVDSSKQLVLPIAQQIADYLENLSHQKGQGKRSRISPAHIVDVTRSLKLIVAECGFQNLRDINREVVQIWVSKQLTKTNKSTRDWSHKTINSHVSALRAFCGWAVTWRGMLKNPLLKFPMLDIGRQKKPRRAMTPDELARLLDVARLRPVAEFGREIVKLDPNGKRTAWKRLPLKYSDMAAAYERGVQKLSPEAVAELTAAGKERELIYLVLLTTGLRQNELATLKVREIEFGPKPFIQLDPENEKAGKGSTVRLRSDVAERLKIHISERQLSLNDFVLRVPDQLIRVLDRDLVAASIEKVNAKGKRLVVHSTRNTFATMLNSAGVTPRIAQEAMRHSDIRLTQNYMDSDQMDVAGAVESLPSWALANALDSSRALENARESGTERQELAHSGLHPQTLLSAEETKKPLENVNLPRVSNVGVIGFEPTTLWSQTRCASQAAPHPE